MSQQQQQQQHPPVEVYPNTVTRQPSSHSNGSFGTVFIILAVIVVISAIACFFGRLCNGRHGQHHPKAKHNAGFSPKEGGEATRSHPNPPAAFQTREATGDIEFGFDSKRFPTAKMATNGEPSRHKPFGNGEMKGPVRFAADHIDQIKAGA